MANDAGAAQYADCNGLLNQSEHPYEGSALFQIAQNGFDLNKLVIGKPGTTADAGLGFIDPTTLGTCIDQAAQKGWKAGIMGFQLPDADSNWIKAAKGSTF